MDSLFKMGSYKLNAEYKDVVPSLVEELKQFRKQYIDNTGKPVRLWPTESYD